MALHAGLATSKILLIAGAGVVGSILLKNGSLSDFLDDTYKVLVKHLKNGNEVSGQNSVDSNLLAQLNILRKELSHLASERSSVTVVTGSRKANGAFVSVTIPALIIGATGYGYLRWKGFSLSDFMYVTRRNMSNAVASVSKKFEHVSTTLSATKRHLTSRLEHLSGNLDQSIEQQAELKNDVVQVRGDVTRYGLEIETVQRLVQTLGLKIDSIENKQDIANSGVIFLCNFVEGMHVTQQREVLQGMRRPQLERASSSFGSTGLKELQSLSHTLESPNSTTEVTVQNQVDAATSTNGPSPRLQRNLSSTFSTGLTRSPLFSRT